ncbi:MAG TPA: 50S ribosomal protein L22 [Ignavibacteria bacterium]|nr:50S ribosomal protein L22 [Ignavibacteria bacterium]
MEARAIKRYSKGSPRKMRLSADLVRNQTVQDAVAILKFSKSHSSDIIEKTVVSAYNNLINKLDTGRIGQDEVFISEIFVDGGPSYKRILPAPQGRAFRIRKRTAHLTVVVSNGEEEEVLGEEVEIEEDTEEAVEEKKAPKKTAKKKSTVKAKKEKVKEEAEEDIEDEEVEEIEDAEDENTVAEEKADKKQADDEDEAEAEEDETIENK